MTQIVATATGIQVVIQNQGDSPVPVNVENEFWVDVYLNPHPAPTAVNQTWPYLGTQGLVWGVTVDALPALVPGEWQRFLAVRLLIAKWDGRGPPNTTT